MSVASDAERKCAPFLTDQGVDTNVLATDDIDPWAPWYTIFRQQWINEMQASEHESFIHPVACMLVASSSEDDPVGALRALQSHATIKRVHSNSFGGHSVLLYYLLVHDGRDTGALQKIDQKFDQVRRAFGQNSSLLKINSNVELIEADNNDREKVSSVWSNNLSITQPLAAAAMADKVFGSMLTMRDVAALKDSVKQMMVRSVVPHMQCMIRVLSDQTANQRRGITGRLFSAGRRYFGASAKTTSTLVAVDGDVYFRYDSPEALMRKLADYSFMLKDFRFAQSVYQVARRDFQSEKAWKCYAGAQEMVGVCKLMLEIHASRAEFDSNFEDAAAMYFHKTQTPCQYLALRTIIIYYELLKHNKLYSFAPGALLRTPSSMGALYGLVSEQAAYTYLKFSHHPELRKFSFYAMIAGQAYKKSEIGGLAHRCFRMVRMALYTSMNKSSSSCKNEDKDGSEAHGANNKDDTDIQHIAASSNWTSIDSFINHELGLQCISTQNYDEALQYFMALLSDDHIPAKLQAKYLQELLQLFLESSDSVAGEVKTATTKPGTAMELSIPAIDPSMTRVIMSPDLEGEDGIFEWRQGGAAPSRIANNSLNTTANLCCSIGEDVAILLVVSNPLTVGITLNGFTLACDFKSVDEDLSTLEVTSPAFDVSSVDSVVLEGGQTVMVSVTITPYCAGDLEIIGAKYLLCDILPVYKPLKLPGRRLNDTAEQRITPTYSPDTRLGFRVDPDFPRLEVFLDDFPDTLVSGSMHRASVRIINRSSHPCYNIALWLSHSSFFDVRSPEKSDSNSDVLESGECSNTQGMYVYSDSVQEAEQVQVTNVLRECSMFVIAGQTSSSPVSPSLSGSEDAARSLHQLPKPIESLSPKETLIVPIWIRGDRVGAHTLRLATGASMAQAATVLSGATFCNMRSRMFDIDLVVTPSLRVNAFVRPSIRNPHERILGIEVENMQPALDIELVQTTFSSGYYKLTPLYTPNSFGLETSNHQDRLRVGPHQTINLMYSASPYGSAVDTKCTASEERAPSEMFTINALRQYIFSNEKPTTLPPPIALVYSNAVLGKRGIDCVHSSLQGYISRSQASRRRNLLRGAYPLIPDKYLPVLFPLYETFGIDFVLFWSEVGGSCRSGHHSISGIDLGVPHDYIVEALNPPSKGIARTWLKDTMQERETLIQSIADRSTMTRRQERPLDVSIKLINVSSSVSSGDAPAFYLADVDITVYNHSWRHAYDFALDLISPTEISKLVPIGVRLDYSGSRSAWSWCGTTHHLMSVAPHGSKSVRARLACSSAGIIDIGLWELNVQARQTDSQTLSLSDISRPTTVDSKYTSKNIECTLYPLQPCFVNIAAN
ncbi:hypothetical protein COEREDRAFT_86042 [Coemansia reversa NRRL 1564]|uniref:TPPC8 first Ig-like domain-containing protein n=1 Tax=Coemansia reversa (strain ATCC 12441 / NRRL 1564) TaxID=763665 RepID=A0A2G5BEG6_COERN|nr:hypothetical protein COEREDRAFT_86042 [Coemansia reversa NRRL 1564]|eukprot:PIA17409.1 hypothetical protein COEREDRAFT_86042 [Coemansia reversa NRRL 1564]